MTHVMLTPPGLGGQFQRWCGVAGMPISYWIRVARRQQATMNVSEGAPSTSLTSDEEDGELAPP